MAAAFFLASSVMAGSVPDQRTRHLPEASQKASPNLMPGTAATRASWMSSTDLMKCVWPRMKLVSSGLSLFTILSCMLLPFFPLRSPRFPGRDERPLGAGGRVVAGPAVDAALDKPGLREHLQERPPPHGTGDSVRPLALVRHFLRQHVIVQEDVGH